MAKGQSPPNKLPEDERKRRRAANQRRWCKNNPERRRVHYKRRRLKLLCSMTYEEFVSLRENQQNLCAICQKPETQKSNGKTPDLSVDHDHKTGKFRALLCGKHNQLLGYADDSPDILRAAANYLDKHKA